MLERGTNVTVCPCEAPTEPELTFSWLEPARWIIKFPLELQRRRWLLLGLCLVVAIPLFFGLIFEPRGQDQRPVHRGLEAIAVGHGRGVQLHGQAQFNAVSVLPRPAQNKVAAGIGESRQRASIHFHAAIFRPVRNAQFQIHLGWFGR